MLRELGARVEQEGSLPAGAVEGVVRDRSDVADELDDPHVVIERPAVDVEIARVQLADRREIRRDARIQRLPLAARACERHHLDLPCVGMRHHAAHVVLGVGGQLDRVPRGQLELHEPSGVDAPGVGQVQTLPVEREPQREAAQAIRWAPRELGMPLGIGPVPHA